MEQENFMQELFKLYKSEANKIFQQLQTDSVEIFEKKNMLRRRHMHLENLIDSNKVLENELNELD